MCMEYNHVFNNKKNITSIDILQGEILITQLKYVRPNLIAVQAILRNVVQSRGTRCIFFFTGQLRLCLTSINVILNITKFRKHSDRIFDFLM